jgi:hypothetical protein
MLVWEESTGVFSRCGYAYHIDCIVKIVFDPRLPRDGGGVEDRGNFVLQRHCEVVAAERLLNRPGATVGTLRAKSSSKVASAIFNFIVLNL